jgi:ABC-type sugar transport system permease subunit
MMDLSTQMRLHNLAWSAGTVVFIILGSLTLAYAAQGATRMRGLTAGEQRKAFWGFLFASPWILGFVIFVLGPGLASLYYSFTDYRLGKPYSWIGLENYRILIEGLGAHGRRFTQAMYNSFYYALVGVPLQIVTALGMAMLLQRQVPGMKLFRLVFYLPVILAGGPAILLAWRYMLASNGGFINITLKSIAESFFLFDWLYRGFIYVTEAFNGFYAGIARGDPVGPLVYTLPAFLGLACLLTLVFGEWTKEKRERAWRVAEIISAILGVILLSRAVVAQPVDPAILYALGLVGTVAGAAHARQGRWRQARLWMWGTLVLLAAALILGLETGGELSSSYLLATLLAAAPFTVFLMVRNNHIVLDAGAIFLGLLVFLRLIPGELDDGQLLVFLKYTLLQSALEHPADLAYLQDFAASAPSGLWMYALVAAVMGILAFSQGWPQGTRRTLMLAALAFFSLQAFSSLLDGIRYFNAYDVIARAGGGVNYHFSTFRQVTSGFPAGDRVPLWLGSELWAKPSLVLITMWSSGAGMLIFLAALKGVPRVFYEAARVDGASSWQSFWSITLPMISPAMFYNVVIGTIAALQTFEAVYIIQNTQTESSLASAAYFLFIRTFRQLEIGQGAAASWILAVIIVLLTVFQFRYSRWVHYGG